MKKKTSVYRENGFHHKGNHSKWLWTIISGTFFIGALIAIIVLAYLLVKKQPTQKHQNLATVAAYAAVTEISPGELITADKLTRIETLVTPTSDYLADETVIGCVATVKIPQDMPLLINMVTQNQLETGQREVECDVIELSANLKDYDYIDVRLMLPNGEDYIVLSKQSVHGLSYDENGACERCYLWLKEQEILYYSASIVDAFLYGGAYLYTTKYIEPEIQEASQITYLPSLSTIELLKENPNLVEMAATALKEQERKSLENRLAYYLNQDVKEVLWKTEGNSFLNDEVADAPIADDSDYFLDEYDKEEP